MRIQDLGIIFIIIILPISIVLGAYTQMEIKTISIQTEYDMKLTAATSDAIKAFQINTANSSTSDIANSKIRDIEASVSVFKASIKSVFGMNGYSEDEMNEYIPALVYTMYDGFYIYSKFNNQNYLYETNADGTYKLDASGNKNPLDKNGENIFGLKPYITYSAEYKVGTNTDVVITYSLDNYISIKGLVEGTYWEESGYLVDGITDVTENSLKYNGIEITKKIVLKEYLPQIDGTLNQGYYKYVRENGTKYYLDEQNSRVIYFLNGNIVELKPTNGQTGIKSAYETFKDKIESSNSAYNFYKTASLFTNKVKGNSTLKSLKYSDAQDYVIIDGKEYVSANTANGETKKINLWPNDNRTIFDFNATTDGTKSENNIECEKSNFNQHRLAIIKNKIRTNLAIAIANFNSQNSIEFQMPELSDADWAKVMNNIAMISFVQGIEIGGKTYNGYTIINNSESKEVVREENIYILGADNFYHRIGDKYLTNGDNIGVGDGKYNESEKKVEAAGRLNLDFNRQYIYKSDGSIVYYYPLNTIYASYNSVVNQNYWDKTYDEINDIYAYVAKQNDELKKAFYTALGREREASKGVTDYKKVLIIGYHPDSTNNIRGTIESFTNVLNNRKDINATYKLFSNANSSEISEFVRANKSKYDLIVLDASYWNPCGLIDQNLINDVLKTTNLFTMGNDSDSYEIFKESRHYTNSSVVAQPTQLGSEKIGNLSILPWSDSGQAVIKFKDNVKVLYKAIYNGTDEYDAIGLKTTGTRRWLHSQISLTSANSSVFEKLVDCVLNGI